MDKRNWKVCNSCPQLSLTEEKQDELRDRGIEEYHICYKYGKRLFHWSNNKDHDRNIYACSECINDNSIE